VLVSPGVSQFFCFEYNYSDKWRRLRWVENVVRVGEEKLISDFCRRARREWSPRRPRHRMKCNIKIYSYFIVIEQGNLDLIDRD
jgi:hypothetical protein